MCATAHVCACGGYRKKGYKVLKVPQSQAADLLSHQEEDKIGKTKQAQIEQTYKKTLRLAFSSPSEVNAYLKD